MTAKIIRLDDYRPRPQVELRKFEQSELVVQMSRAQLFKVEMKATEKITDQDERIEALSKAYAKFKDRKYYGWI